MRTNRPSRPAAARRGSRASLAAIIAISLAVTAACGSTAPGTPTTAAGPATPGASAASRPAWYDIPLTDVRTGQTFAISDFAGKVVLVEAMAEWCPTCVEQQAEVKNLHDLLASSGDVVSVSLDIDIHEDGRSLKDYATTLGYDWHFAVAPLEVARALGNLYSAEYLNPPYSPMLLIDRNGAATSLPYGVKTADFLRTTLEPYLAH